MKFKMRHRNIFLLGGALIAAAFSFYTDPDKQGLSTFLGGLSILQLIWAIGAAHLARKALTDYPESDQQMLFKKAAESPVGAGLALIALSIMFVGLLLAFAPRAHAADLPAGFAQYGPILKAEQTKYWPEHPHAPFLAALIEQESCASLKSPKCWNPGARLKSSREEGAGLGQITRAYRADGTLRFDSLSDLRSQYSDALGDWSWDNVYTRPDLQLRALVILSRDSAKPFKASTSWLHFGDAGYNGGVAGVQKERRACKLTPGCDPDRWFGNVEAHCMKSRQPLYGGKSACDINREHVKNVFTVRSKKYEGFI